MPLLDFWTGALPQTDAMSDQGKPPQGREIQYAALPYRLRADGAVEILLVTSRETERWVIPKGWPMKGRQPHVSAAREALEEAGLVGRTDKEPIGSYRYNKRLKDGAEVPCTVEVFPMEVRLQKKKWPEKGQRTLRWFPPEEAAEAVDEAGLSQAIRNLRARTSREVLAADTST
jgi:8-oxo-dGTP pyrophosphatase MutT (NUDIX family)